MKEFIRKCSHQMLLLLGCFVVVVFFGGVGVFHRNF